MAKFALELRRFRIQLLASLGLQVSAARHDVALADAKNLRHLYRRLVLFPQLNKLSVTCQCSDHKAPSPAHL